MTDRAPTRSTSPRAGAHRSRRVLAPCVAPVCGVCVADPVHETEHHSETPVSIVTADLVAGTGATICHVSAALVDLFGLTREELVGSPLETLIGSRAWNALADQLDRGEAEQPVEALVATSGAERAVVLHWTVREPQQGRERTLVVALEDMTPRRQLVHSLRSKALHDPLTGLANRTRLLEHLGQSLRDADRSGGCVVVAFVDVDDLKTVNESLGHEAGDELLMAVAHRLGRTLGAGDIAGRLGGDEFAVVSAGLAPDHDIEGIGDRILGTVTGPCVLAGRTVAASVSVGLAVSREGDAAGAEALLNRADEALRRAKRRGKSRVVVFDDALDTEVRQRKLLEFDLRQAGTLGQLRLAYQPVVDLQDGSILGAEALLRWQHPTRGLLPPLDFVPLAEASGSIVQIGAWVLHQVCAQTEQWTATHGGPPPPAISVNVSARQLGHGDVARTIQACLQDTRLAPAALKVEVTESVLTQSLAARRELWEIDGLGVQVGIDDFGTGYASLTYLQQLPVRFLKIDRSFVADMTRDPVRHAIVASVTHLATALDIRVIAEGVEEPEQAEALLALGCTAAQGFLYSRPLRPSQLAVAVGAGR
ncbi:MAG: diguanylate cyclase [Actinotalea sp.]|nr:diguanylate cyclase [Actinotalea sp.]